MSKVQLYIYDLSQGLAAQLSPMFLGQSLKVFITQCNSINIIQENR